MASRSRGRSATLLGFRFQALHSSSRSQLGLHGAKVMVFGRRENFLREAVDVLTRAGCEAGIRRANMRLSSASCEVRALRLRAGFCSGDVRILEDVQRAVAETVARSSQSLVVRSSFPRVRLGENPRGLLSGGRTRLLSETAAPTGSVRWTRWSIAQQATSCRRRRSSRLRASRP